MGDKSDRPFMVITLIGLLEGDRRVDRSLSCARKLMDLVFPPFCLELLILLK